MAKAQKSRIITKVKKTAGRQWKASRTKEASVAGGRSLPGGIENGLAQVVNAEWREAKDGTPFLMIQYLIHEPEDYQGVKQTVSYFFADSQFRSVQEVTDRLASDLQLMGVDTAGLDLEELDEALQGVVKAKRFIKYRTRSGTLDDGQEWFKFDVLGVADIDEPEAEEPEVEESEDDAAFDDDEDDELPFDEDSADDEEPEGEPEDDDGWEPEVGDIYDFKPPKSKRAVEVEVVAVNRQSRTVTVKNLETGVRITKVPWDALEGE